MPVRRAGRRPAFTDINAWLLRTDYIAYLTPTFLPSEPETTVKTTLRPVGRTRCQPRHQRESRRGPAQGGQGPGDTEYQVLLVAVGKIAPVHPDVWEYDSAIAHRVSLVLTVVSGSLGMNSAAGLGLAGMAERAALYAARSAPAPHRAAAGPPTRP
ncbi:hypothetical protein GCM10029963_48620 [Micromonospora andamanensis]|nr:hypothetical protein Vwe01_45790 [Micromonospora andamanensis]